MQIPAEQEIRALHEKHAPTPEARDVVYTHSSIVSAIAEQLHARSGAGLDIDLIRAGSLLHDVGVYRLYDDAGQLDHASYIRHGVLGYELLREEGLPEEVCRFASHHTGVGLTREDVLRQGLPLPPADYLAETGEEALVMYADKFHSKTSPPAFLTAEAYATSVQRFGAGKVMAFESLRARFGEPDLVPLAARYGHRVVTAG
ncbi:MAG TPA: HD domain-containing protein [Trebonia sp.]|nr:HD domain-containing protein [Trebonia sp.]